VNNKPNYFDEAGSSWAADEKSVVAHALTKASFVSIRIIDLKTTGIDPADHGAFGNVAMGPQTPLWR
jgi:hypothetical protein